MATKTRNKISTIIRDKMVQCVRTNCLMIIENTVLNYLPETSVGPSWCTTKCVGTGSFAFEKD